MSIQTVSEYLAAVNDRARAAALGQGFHSTQVDLLLRTLEQYEAASHKNPLGNPLSMPYLIARAWGREMDEPAVELGAAASLYLLALDLIDDVQDDDLAGKPHEQAGPALAVNTGVTLLFLSFDRLRRALGGATDAPTVLRHLELMNRVSLAAAGGQHRDLIGGEGARTPDEVLAMQEAKTSSLVLLAEAGALLAGVDDELRARYRAVGTNMARLVQVVDDLRDIFGKRRSPDLAAGRMTYPVACFFESASSELEGRFTELARGLPATLPGLRRVLYDAGAVSRSAAALERFRRNIHAEIAATGNTSAHHRTFLDVVDGLVSSVYSPRTLAVSASLWRPTGAWHDEVRALSSQFDERMAPYAPPPLPRFVPWHQPQWMYDAKRRVVAYPDLREQAAEIVPFQAALLGTDDRELVRELLMAQAPAVMAHELFHHWRDAAGRLGAEHWHEEWCANRLAVAYCRQYAPAALETAKALASKVLARTKLPDSARRVLALAKEPGALGPGYHMDLATMAVAHLAMIQDLVEEPFTLGAEVERWLRPEAPERRTA